ncbi:MAG TPA: response regulator [Chloroflexi bacterium]|nr:response regulator [Chloroflexota bacterium]
MDTENSPRIIYIEDDPEMIELVHIILNRRGFKVKGAQWGRQGVDMVQQDRPDLVLLDLMMPDLDGWDVYHQLKANPDTQDIPIIVISAKSQPIDRVLGLQIAKVDDYVSKPFSPHELISSVDRVLNSRQRPIL